MSNYKKTYLIGLKIAFTTMLLLLPIGIWWGLVCVSYYIDSQIPGGVRLNEIMPYQEPRLWVFVFWFISVPFCLALYFPIIKFIIKRVNKLIAELKSE